MREKDMLFLQSYKPRIGFIKQIGIIKHPKVVAINTSDKNVGVGREINAMCLKGFQG